MIRDEHIKNIEKTLQHAYYPGMLLLQHINSYVRDKVVIDCGANCGELSYYFLKGGASHVHAFEPNPPVFDLLNLLKCAELTAYKKALSNMSGSSVLVIPYDALLKGDNDGVAQLGKMNPELVRRFPNQFIDGNCKKEIVDVVRLDDIITDDIIGLIKIDVEGHEIECAEGAFRIIQKQKPALLVEIAWTNNHTTFDYFCNLGYDAYYCKNSELKDSNGTVLFDEYSKLLPINGYNESITDYLFLPRK